MFIILTFQLHFFFFFNDTATTEIYTLSLHDALPISSCEGGCRRGNRDRRRPRRGAHRARVCEPALRLGLAGCGATIPAGDRAQRELSDRAFLVCVLSVGRGTDSSL